MSTAQWTILGITLIIVLIEIYASHGTSVNPTLQSFIKTMFSGISISTSNNGTGETVIESPPKGGS